MNLKYFSNIVDDVIYNSSYSETDKINIWNSIKEKIIKLKLHPDKFQTILNILNKNFSEKNNIKILDHGSGGCYTILYLHALGYKEVFGVDVGGSCKEINDFFFLISGDSRNRKIIYDGKKLPFGNYYFDFIFSQQVLEHVPFDNQENFIKEEKRVLKTGGIVYHQIPHKLSPYESHLKIWFWHWLPKKFFILACKILGKNYKFVQDHLWFKYPWTYLYYLRSHIGTTKNLSINRIRIFQNESKEFFGMSLLLRKLSSLVYKIPLIGNLISNFLSYFIMLETISIKND